MIMANSSVTTLTEQAISVHFRIAVTILLAKKMTLLGSGGAASSICVQAALDGAREIDAFKHKR